MSSSGVFGAVYEWLNNLDDLPGSKLQWIKDTQTLLYAAKHLQ